MIERLRSAIQYRLRPTDPASILALGTGLLLGAADLAAPDPVKLIVAVLYLALGIVGVLLAERVLPLGFQQRAVDAPTIYLAALALLTGVGLVSLGHLAVWWLSLVAVALLVTLLSSQTLSEKFLSYIVAFQALAGLAGIIAALRTASPPALETALLGLGLLVFGPGVLLLKPASQPRVLTDREDRTLPKKPMAFDLSVNQMLQQLHVTSDGLVRAVQAINEVMAQQSQGAAQQAAMIVSTHELLEQLLSLSEQIREQARLITQMASQASETSQNGQNAIAQAIQGMEEIRTQVAAIAGTILTLTRLTRRIDEIINSVSEIATQSNLLALNASIEAARAGAQGRGFAVVADEVRTLSQQSTQAARQVRDILGEIQNAMKETVQATEVGMRGVDSGMTMTEQASKVMVQLADNVSASHEAVHAIYAYIRQQVDNLEQIAISMERIDRITQQNLTNTRMVETVSTNLTRLAGELQSTVGLKPDEDLPGVEQQADQHREQETEDQHLKTAQHDVAQSSL